MNLTPEQLNQIDKAACATVLEAYKGFKSIHIDTVWNEERHAFITAAIAEALKLATADEGDLITFQEIHDSNAWDSLADTINQRHRERVTALKARAEKAENREAQAKEYIKKLDGIIEEVGGVTASCVNPYEDLKAALIGQKQRAEKAEADLEHTSRHLQNAFKELAALRSQPSNSREAFEKWFTQHGMRVLSCSRDDAKMIWQAAVQWARQQGEKEDPWQVSSDVAAAILRARDAHTLGDMAECYHELYRIADHNFTCFDPWERLTKIAGDKYSPAEKQKHPTLPTPPTGHHLATEEERRCLPKGTLWRERGGTDWFDASGAIGMSGLRKCDYACPDLPPNKQTAFENWLSKTSPSGDHESVMRQWRESPDYRDLQAPMPCVQFDADGKLLPPPHGQWHREDFTPEMLAGGWRPVLLGEQEQPSDECYNGDEWHNNGDYHKGAIGYKATGNWIHHRTRRPLSPAPEPEPEPEWVPLSAEDVPPGSFLRFEGHTLTWEAIVGTDENGVWDSSNTLVEWQELFENREILRPGQTWQACRKPKPSTT